MEHVYAIVWPDFGGALSPDPYLETFEKEFWRLKSIAFWLKKNFGGRNLPGFASKRILAAERRQGAPAKFDRVLEQTSPASVDWRLKSAKGRRPSLTGYQNKLPPPRLIGGRKAPRGAGQICRVPQNKLSRPCHKKWNKRKRRLHSSASAELLCKRLLLVFSFSFFRFHAHHPPSSPVHATRTRH